MKYKLHIVFGDICWRKLQPEFNSLEEAINAACKTAREYEYSDEAIFVISDGTNNEEIYRISSKKFPRTFQEQIDYVKSGKPYATPEGRVFHNYSELTLHKGYWWYDIGCPIAPKGCEKNLPIIDKKQLEIATGQLNNDS
jgi:hypothetical protein